MALLKKSTKSVTSFWGKLSLAITAIQLGLSLYREFRSRRSTTKQTR